LTCAVGRLTFAQDTWYGTRRFKYNQAGELVETVNGVGGRTRFDYDPRGRLVKITDPLGGVTTRTYTDTGPGHLRHRPAGPGHHRDL